MNTTRKGMGGHQSAHMKNDEWITPRYITEPLGSFDLDPCAPSLPPWPIARQTYSKIDDGLTKEWVGRVWLNPPYGLEGAAWMRRMAMHRNGIALLFARTETAMFYESVWYSAQAICFLKGRPHFHYVDGTRASSNSGAPVCLIAYSDWDTLMLGKSGLGKVVIL